MSNLWAIYGNSCLLNLLIYFALCVMLKCARCGTKTDTRGSRRCIFAGINKTKNHHDNDKELL